MAMPLEIADLPQSKHEYLYWNEIDGWISKVELLCSQVLNICDGDISPAKITRMVNAEDNHSMDSRQSDG